MSMFDCVTGRYHTWMKYTTFWTGREKAYCIFCGTKSTVNDALEDIAHRRLIQESFLRNYKEGTPND